MQIFGVDPSAQEERVAAVRRNFPNPGFEWYRYDSFANLAVIKDLLSEWEKPVIDAARFGGMLDLGCGDGDLSFFFESLGCEVHAVDHFPPNLNGMRGVRLLARELGSKIQIHEIDLDTQFTVPRKRYGLVLFLGILYHLKNPLFALEQIARHCDYGLLSTRVARRLPDGTPLRPDQPLAYLLDLQELNHDDSNYWIFTEGGLRRILKRAHWEILAWLTLGDTSASDPVSLDHDERAFCLIRSQISLSNADLVSGWHHAEASGWRWTERRFSARFKLSDQQPYTRLVLHVHLPPDTFDKSLTVAIRIDGLDTHPAVFDTPGDHTIARPISPSGESLLAEFELDKTLPQRGEDKRELGMIVTFLELE